MRPWVDHVTFSSSALEYVVNILLKLLIVVGGILLLIIGAFLFAS